MSEFSKFTCPGQFVEDGAESDEPADAGRGRQGRNLRTQARHPAEDVRIAAQLLQTDNLGMLGGQIDEEITHRCVVVPSAGRTECGGEGFDGTRAGRCQGMLEWRAAPALHDEILDWGRMHCAAARAY